MCYLKPNRIVVSYDDYQVAYNGFLAKIGVDPQDATMTLVEYYLYNEACRAIIGRYQKINNIYYEKGSGQMVMESRLNAKALRRAIIKARQN